MGVFVCACLGSSDSLHRVPGKRHQFIWHCECLCSVYLISGVESQAGCRSKNTTKMMLKRQHTVKADNYDNTAQFGKRYIVRCV